jgi:NAD(P)-dependent dehydrogenase (short-subunit alcohol dehydrogenase family)
VLSSSGKGKAPAQELGGIGVTRSNQSNDDLKRLGDRTMERWAGSTCWSTVRGHGPRVPILEITDEQWHTGLDVYFLNVVRATHLVTPIMLQQKAGSILNISTVWASEPSPMFATSAVA